MALRRYGTFTGGIDLPEEKDATIGLPIEPAGLLERLCVPLGWPGASQVRPMVSVGQEVSAGQELARTQLEEFSIHAPASGRVEAIDQGAIAGRYSFTSCPTVVLTDLKDIPVLEDVEEQRDWQSLSCQDLYDHLAQSHLLVHHRGVEPLIRWIDRARKQHCHLLVANVMEQEPMVTANHSLLAQRSQEVMAGLSILSRVIETTDTALVVNRRRTDSYRPLLNQTRDYNINLIALTHKYPTGNDIILTKILTRREVPLGQNPMNVGVAIIDAATCLAVYRWIACQQRLGGRVVTVAGKRARKPGNYFVPFGASCDILAGAAEGPLLYNGPMTGLRCPHDAVVSAGTEAILAFAAQSQGTPTPCIRCGWCSDHCPARLNVAALNDSYELGLIEHGRESGVMACVACGVCSYLCPARLPLAQRMNSLKWAIAKKRSILSATAKQGEA